MKPEELKSRLKFALAAAREAGEITLRHFRRDDLDVERKSDDSPVTIADREAEQHLRALISKVFPDDAILGEEFPAVEGTSGVRWILDPIDGTKSFIAGVPLYGTLIGMEYEGRSAVGVIHIPALDESVYAATGCGAWYRRGDSPPKPARVSRTKRLAEGLFLTSEVKTFADAERAGVYTELEAAARLARTWGDCYGYLLVATGRAEVMVDPRMNVWDCAALQPILEEAGGTFTDFNAVPTIHAGEAVATNGVLFDEVLAITRGR